MSRKPFGVKIAAAKIGLGTRLGVGVILEPGAVLGENCRIGNYVTIHRGSRLGNGVRVDDQAVIGKEPMHAACSATTVEHTLPPTTVGDGCIVGTGAILYRGASIGGQVLVADGAVVREDCQIGKQTIVGRNATVENFCVVGERCKIQSHAYLCAHSTVENDCFLGPGVVTSNDNYMGRGTERFSHYKGITMKRGARLGAGVVVLPGKTIGEQGTVGAGSLVTKDVGAQEVWYGVPARHQHMVPDGQLL